MSKYIAFILYIWLILPLSVFAIKTNINEVTDLFDKHIENKDELFQDLEEQNNNALGQIQSGEHHDVIEGMSDANKKAQELNAIDENDLESEGRKTRLSKEYQFYDENELEPDYTKAGNTIHKLDSEEILSATEVEMRKIGDDFMSKLNSEGFNCKTVKGAVQKEPVHHIEIKREGHKDTAYDQLFCEEARNSYNCTDSVSVRCISPTTDSLTPSDFSGTTLPINLNSSTGILTFGWNKNHTMHGGAGKQYDHSVTFNIANKEGIAEFALKDVGWDDHLRVTINDRQIFMGPLSGDQLELVKQPHHFIGSILRVKINDSDNRYNPEYNTWHTRSPNVNLLPYLKNGKNVINIRLIVGGSGGLWLRFKASFKKCTNWQEDWSERCILK